MPSPFPGMIPYLEQEDVWHDFHERIIPRLADSLTPLVRPKYIVKLDEHIYVHEIGPETRQFAGRADVAVSELPGGRGASAGLAATIDAPAYGLLAAALDVERQAYIEIRDRLNRELVCVIKVLSPSNKRPGPDRDQYLSKRWQILAGPVHLVEIDLLRAWPRMPVDGLPPCDYCVVVSRSEERPRVGLWPFRVRDPLPAIPVPLRPPEGNARVDLSRIVNDLYDAAGYEDYIYLGMPHPPLSAEDQAWAEALLDPPPG